jgi:hypothetical protein
MRLGHVQRLSLEPVDPKNCNAQSPAHITEPVDGSRTLCCSRNAAYETMELKVDQVLVGEAGATW